MKIPGIKKVISLAVGLAVVSTMLLTAIPAAASNEVPANPPTAPSVYLDPGSLTHVTGDYWTMDVRANVGTAQLRGFDLTIGFKNDLEVKDASGNTGADTVVYNTSAYGLKTWASAHTGCSITPTAGSTVANPATGYDSGLRFGEVIGGATDGGQTGDFKLFTFTFHALGNNLVTRPAILNLANQGLITTAHPAGWFSGVTYQGTTVTLGVPVYPDLIISAASTTGTATPNGSSLTYNMTFTVKNQGSASAANVQAQYSINGATAILVNCGTLAGGGGQFVFSTTTPITVQASGTDNIAIVADPANNIDEGANENNNTGSTSYTALPNLTVSASTSSTTNDQNYTLHFTVTNAGAIGAGASQATYNDGTGAHNVSIGAIGAGLSETHDIAMVVSSGLSATVQIDANTGSTPIAEFNTTDNHTSTTYSYTASNRGSTGVSGTILDDFSFTVPTDVNWNTNGNGLALQPGIDPQMHVGANTANRTMTITSRKMWEVDVNANNEVAVGSDGNIRMTKYVVAGNTYTPAVHLYSPLEISTTGEQDIYLTKTALKLADGAAADLSNQGAYQGGTINGYTRTAPVLFSQPVQYQDPALANPAFYHVVVTFTCNVSDY